MSKNNTTVLYHASCLDGFAASYVAWLKFGDTADYIPVNYGNPPPDVTGKRVYILDFSYPREVLVAMDKIAESITVLDHHKSAQEDLIGLPYAIFDMKKSGCGLAWQYFNPKEPLPRFLELIQDRDLWRFEFDDTKAFNAALWAFVPRDHVAWSQRLPGLYQRWPGDGNDRIRVLTQRGQDLLKVFDAEVAELTKRQHKMALDKACCYTIACNANTKYASELGNALAKQSGGMAAIYSYDGYRQEWQFSLRSVGDFDVSAIAKVYGGGGHRNAAGFAVKRLEDL